MSKLNKLSEIQMQILNKLMFTQKLRYSELEKGLPYMKSYLVDKEGFKQYIIENVTGNLKY